MFVLFRSGWKKVTGGWVNVHN